MPELEDVLAEALLALEQVEDVGAGHLGAAAVAREHDLVADVDGGEAGGRGVDVEQVVLLVLGERLGLGLARGELRGIFDVGAQLAARHLGERPVAHAGGDLRLHGLPPLWGATRAASSCSRSRRADVSLRSSPL